MDGSVALWLLGCLGYTEKISSMCFKTIHQHDIDVRLLLDWSFQLEKNYWRKFEVEF